MPITKTTGYLASDGVVYGCIEDAQVSELSKLLLPMFERTQIGPVGDDASQRRALAKELLVMRDPLLSILTTGPTSRPSARKRAGTMAPKRAAKRATEASINLGKSLKNLLDTIASPASGEQAKAGFKAMRQAAGTAEEANGLQGVVPAEPAGQAA